MRKIFCIAMAGMLLLGFAACNGKTASGQKDTLTGTPAEVLIQVRENAQANLATSIGMEVTGGNAKRILGLTEEEFGEYAESAYVEAPVLGTTPQNNAVVKCKDAAAAKQVKKRIAGGFDAGQWAKAPEQGVAVESGSYVLLAVGTVEATNAFAQAFGRLSEDNVGETDVFYPAE